VRRRIENVYETFARAGRNDSRGGVFVPVDQVVRVTRKRWFLYTRTRETSSYGTLTRRTGSKRNNVHVVRE